MSEIKYNRAAARMKMREILPSVPGDLLDYALFMSMDAAQVDAALAAKDARISELEGLLREWASMFEAGIASGPLMRLRDRTTESIAGQQQAEPEAEAERPYLDCLRDSVGVIYGDRADTPSEDGGEVNIVAFLMRPDFCEPYVSLHRDTQTSVRIDPLMTVAQHSRIVAAKDAEIARLRTISDNYFSIAAERTEQIVARDKEIAQLRAQPARQVGGGEREQFEGAASALLYYLNRTAASDEYVVPETQTAWELWQACCLLNRAALAPAAVALPEKLKSEPYTTIDKGSKNYKAGWNACINEVARLNRRAIPVELLERIAKHLEWDGDPEKTAYTYAQQSDALAVELRALLGNVE